MLLDQSLDQTLDHKTKSSGPNLLVQAEKLLLAVAGADAASNEHARQLCEAILAEARVINARELQTLLAARSPFALVRAIELAELVLSDFPSANQIRK